MQERTGGTIRDLLPSLPLDMIMVETDARFMGYLKERRSSKPADCVEVARSVAEGGSANLYY
jgi:Tat protein secretion system quality control protein TatD with DNase activity